MKILVIEDDADLREVIGFYIESEIGTEVAYAGSVREAKEMFLRSMNYSAIVCDYALGDGTAEDVFRALTERKSSVPFVLCSAYDPASLPLFKDAKIGGFVLKSEIFEKLKGTLETIFESTHSPPSTGLDDSEYCRIQTQTVLRLGILNCDLYLRLQPGKFIRVLRQDDVIETSDLPRFDKKSVDYLYVRTQDRAALLKKLTEDLLDKTATESPSEETVYQISTGALEMIGEMTRRYGFSAEVQDATRASVALAVKNIQNNEILAGLFGKVMVDPEQYLPSHSVALAYLCCGVASRMGWKSDAIFYKLTLAAFLHDLLLSSNELAEIQTLAELKTRLEGKPQELEEYLRHPQECARLVHSMKDVPLDVDVIIAQHHERPDGSGFPGHINHVKISPLSAVFILAHELFQFQYASPTKTVLSQEIIQFLHQLPEEYHHGYFKNVLKAVLDSVSLSLS
jgi:response regulator RpfG family c-di-GMP phosphodiesterase